MGQRGGSILNEVIECIKKRRSVRRFELEQLKQEELDLIIEAGIYAPTGHNTQPWHFTIIQDKEVIKHISDESKKAMAKSEDEWIRNLGQKESFDVTYNAPTLMIVSGKKDALTWQADCAAAIQNMLLAAESLNIGSVWLGFAVYCFQSEGEAEKLQIPEGYEPYYGVAFGYKAKNRTFIAPKRNYNVVNYIR